MIQQDRQQRDDDGKNKDRDGGIHRGFGMRFQTIRTAMNAIAAASNRRLRAAELMRFASL
jgi:hypothetical protein